MSSKPSKRPRSRSPPPSVLQRRVTDTNKCPICQRQVEDRSYYQCLNCEQKMHPICILSSNRLCQKGNTRLLSDDIIICPACRSDNIGDSLELSVGDKMEDMNAEIKEAVRKNPYQTGGKTNKNKKTKKNRKTNKFRKTKK